MEKTIVIADDNLDFCNNMNYFFNNINNEIRVVGIAHTGQKTLELIDFYTPDFLILDLNMPNKSGLEILEEIDRNGNCKTKIIITSAEIPMLNRLNLIRSKNLLNVFIKPFDVSLLFATIKNATLNDYKDVDMIIDSFLHEFNFNFASQSYHYLFLVIKKLLYRPFVLNDAYKEIALEQNITAKNVKWGIEKLVTSMVRYTPKEVLAQYISYNPSPSPKVFISEIIKLTRKELDSI